MSARNMILFLAMTATQGSALVTDGLAIGKSPKILFKEKWIDGTAPDEPNVQVQAIGPDTFVIRQSIKTNFEAPFVYLLFGREKALLLDTGAGGFALRPVVDKIMGQWLTAHQRQAIPLIVAHSHNHRDHIAGDHEFIGRSDTTIVGLGKEEVARFFGIDRWPDEIGRLNLGGRSLRVIPTPGHQTAHIMLYDPALRLLLSGDALYPGRLYLPINHLSDARSSLARLSRFVATHPVRAVLGAHIEMTDEPGRDYPQSALTHPAEHRLELSVSSIAELKAGLRAPLDIPEQPQIHDDFIIYPMPPRE